MATPPDEIKLFKPFLPPLQLCASAKIAVQLHQEFGLDALEEAFKEIQRGNSETEGMNEKIRRAKESLLLIPAHLREAVMHAAHGSFATVVYWKQYYAFHFGLEEAERSFQFRSDGTVDAVKTAQVLVRSEQLDLRERSKLACTFFTIESIEALWPEMVVCGQIKIPDTFLEFMNYFSVRWLGEDILENNEIDDPRVRIPRCSAFSSLMIPKDRHIFLQLLCLTSCDDLRFCYGIFTRREEEQLLREGRAYRLLRPLLLWPLQNTFLPTVAKLWDYMDDISFRKLLAAILSSQVKFKDFNYSELFEGFWSASPLHLKESALSEPELRQKIDSFFDEKIRTRKNVEDGSK